MKTIDSMLRDSCLAHPTKPALREKVSGSWRETSYADLWADARQVAAGLQHLELQNGAHVALLAPSSSRWVVAYFGALLAGAVVVPVDKELKAVELKHLLGDCGARLIFTTRGYLDTLLEIKDDLPALEYLVLIEQRQGYSARHRETAFAIGRLVEEWRQLCRELELPTEKTTPLEKLAGEVCRLVMPVESPLPREDARDAFRPKPDHPPRLLDFEDFRRMEPPAAHSRTARDVAVILYTSGTTGRSKGAMLSHANILANIRGACRLFQLDETMHTLSFLPINHVFEQVCGILLPLSLGGKVSFAESLKKLGDNLTEVRPSFFLGVPAVYRVFYDRIMKNVRAKAISRALLAFPPTRPVISAKIRKRLGEHTKFISGGAALDPEIARGFGSFGVRILQGYGITETAPVISAEPPEAPRIGTVGLPLEDVQVRIHEPNGDGIGEILVRGPNVMLGYYNNPEATAEVLIDGWYHTGDLGHLAADGYLTIRGRAKNLIVTPNGKNVYPEELEIELLKSPYIAEVMVYGHRVSASAEEVHAMIYPDFDAIDAHVREQARAPLSEAELEELIRGEVQAIGKRLADYKRVRKFTLREEEFPKTTTRKIKRFAVEARIPAG